MQPDVRGNRLYGKTTFQADSPSFRSCFLQRLLTLEPYGFIVMFTGNTYQLQWIMTVKRSAVGGGIP